MGLFLESTLTEILIIFLSYLIYSYSKKGLDYWEILGVKFNKPLPLIGNSINLIFPRKSFAEFHQDLYKQYPKEKFVGYYEFLTPCMLLRDPEIIQTILVKDATYFYDRLASEVDGELNPLDKHLATLKGQNWKTLRSKLSTVFTSRKLKTMQEELSACTDELCKVLEKTANNDKPQVDINECMKKFSLDVTGSCVFGLRFDCLNDPTSEFVKRSTNVFSFSLRLVVGKLLSAVHHRLPKLVGYKERSEDVEGFFLNFVKDSIRTREVNNFKRNDLFQLLIDLRKEELNSSKQAGNGRCQDDQLKEDFKTNSLMNDVVFAANTFLFLNAGTDTTGSALTFCILELARNLHIQNKLHQEIQQTMEKTGNNITYDDIKSLKYMEKVISETLRKYPVGGSFQRICTKNYKIPDTDIILKEGVLVFVSPYALHHDPQYYPDPETFDPERFSEASAKRPSCTYLPFGDGMRHCIGMRFALIEMKLTLCKVLSQFEFRMCADTKYPVLFQTRSMLLTSSHDIHLNVYKRNP